MEELFVPREQALALKELGLSDFVFGYYYTLNGTHWKFGTKEQYNHLDDMYDIGGSFTIAAPLYQQALKFFRDKYGYVIQYTPYEMSEEDFSLTLYHKFIISEYDPWRGGRRNTIETDISNTYEQAELECIKKLIEKQNLK